MSNILDKFRKNDNFVTCEGGQKEKIYKKEVVSTKKDRVQARKIRNIFFKSIISFSDAKNTKKVENLCKDFVDFYKATYLINDYSFSSIASANTQEEEKKVINNALQIIRKTLNIKEK